ncbi:MAG: hypothetical protein AAF717_09000 [Bacteroidota bacterium]
MKRLFLILLFTMGYWGFSQGYPQMDTYTLVPTNAPTSPLEGQTYYDQTSKKVFVWDGTQWLDQTIVDTDNQIAIEVPNAPAGTIAATNVQDALDELASEKAEDGAVLKKNVSNLISSGTTIHNGSGFGIDMEPGTNFLTLSSGGSGNVNLEISPNSLKVYGLSNAEIDAVGDEALITKGYADATYTDDQTASEVTYDNVTSGLTATTTQAAIDELALSGGSGLTTDQLNRLLNENKFSYVTKSANFSYTSDDIEVASGIDIGKKVIVESTAGSVEGELENADIPLGESLIIQSNGGTIVSYFAQGETGLFQDGNGLSGNQLTVENGATATVIRKTVDFFRVNGEGTIGTQNIAFWPVGNAASPGTSESNALPLWAVDNGNITTNTDAQDGTHALFYDFQGGSEVQDYEVVGLDSSKTYTISVYTKKVSSSPRDTQIRIGNEDIVSSQSLFLKADQTSYTLKTGIFQPTGSSVTLRFEVGGTASGVEQGLFDNITIVEN